MPPPGDDERSRWGGTLIYGLLVPFTLAVVGLGGWYMVTGETPLDLADRLSHGPRIALPMPARPGSDKPGEALIKPPSAAQAPALSPVQMPVAPQPTTPTPAPEEKPAEKPAGPPQIALPSTAPAMVPEPEHAAPAPAAKPAAPPAAAPPTSSFVAPPPPPALDEPAIPPGGESLAPPSFAQLQAPKEAAKPLAPAPLPDLLRQTGAGSLPIRAGGREAWKVYQR
ncbi:MAG TPA: hypothetical protein VKP60_05910, partial [Magnetospirillaceae bacterium]|nr:hypothetical protein [Magnetospirillaceae bacterium]